MRDSRVGHSPSLYFSFPYFIHATLPALSFSLSRVNAPMKFNTVGLVRALNFLNNEKDSYFSITFLLSYYKNIKSLCRVENREIARRGTIFALSKYFYIGMMKKKELFVL